MRIPLDTVEPARNGRLFYCLRLRTSIEKIIQQGKELYPFNQDSFVGGDGDIDDHGVQEAVDQGGVAGQDK